MKWQEIEESWPAFVKVVGGRWPRADRTKLLGMEGDRERFEAHIASTHDLTPAEVREDVDTWLKIGRDLATVGTGPIDTRGSSET